VVDVVNDWALERLNFDFQKPDASLGASHFTQIVWRATTDLGCSRALCRKFPYYPLHGEEKKTQY